jgi:hypothetical protein
VASRGGIDIYVLATVLSYCHRGKRFLTLSGFTASITLEPVNSFRRICNSGFMISEPLLDSRSFTAHGATIACELGQ